MDLCITVLKNIGTLHMINTASSVYLPAGYNVFWISNSGGNWWNIFKKLFTLKYALHVMIMHKLKILPQDIRNFKKRNM